MTTNTYQEQWFATAAGRKTDPDGDGSYDCCDTPKDYHQAIFGVGWKLGWPGAGNARDMLYTYDTDYYTQILNNPNDPNLLPQRGDIIVWNGNAYNPYGHIGVVLGATPNGVTIMQEDTGLQCPMFVGTLNYYLPTAGMVSGWLRPNFTVAGGTVNPQGGGVTQILAGNQRRVGSVPVNEHAYARTTSPVTRVAGAGTIEQFTGWLHGEQVTINGFTSDIWFTDADGAEWCGGFEDQGTHDLKDMNPVLLGNQRKVGSVASNERRTASTTAPIVRTAAAGTIEQFTGYVHGESVTASKGFTSDIWFVDAQGAEWCGNFEDQGTHDLPDLTPKPAPGPAPAPAPAPAPLAALDIVDVSKFQTQDISAIAADGFIIGVTAGMTIVNPIWQQQLTEARKTATNLIGLYHAPNHGPETADAASQHFWDTVKGSLLGGERLLLDFEFMDLTDVAWAHEFITNLRHLSASKADLYIGWATERASDFSPMADPAQDIRIWMAQYPWSTPQVGFVHWDNPPVPKYWKSVEAWQYTSHGRVPAYPGVDLDFSAFYDTADQWKARGVPAPAPVPVDPNPPVNPVQARPLVLLTPTGDGTTVDVTVQMPNTTEQIPANITTLG